MAYKTTYIRIVEPPISENPSLYTPGDQCAIAARCVANSAPLSGRSTRKTVSQSTLASESAPGWQYDIGQVSLREPIRNSLQSLTSTDGPGKCERTYEFPWWPKMFPPRYSFGID